MTENPKELLLKAINENDCCSLLDLATQSKSKQSSINLEELFSTLKQSELNEIGEKLFKLLEDQCIKTSNLAADGNPNYNEETVNAIKAVVPIVHLSFQHSSCIPASMLQIAVLLNDMLLNIPENEDSLKNSISQLCENLWNKNLLEKEHIGKNAFIYLLQRTLHSKGTKTDVKRVWTMRKNILLINNEAPNFSDILKLLEKCAVSSLYLSVLEGQKFISFLYGLDISIIKELHKAVRSQLLECTLKESEIYGTIYFKAWANAPNEIKEQLETCCIQDFMFHAIHVARNIPHSLAPVLRKFLSSFHMQKKNRCVSKMLTRLYEPILWRSLKVANGYVRANAATLFFDAFPLEDPDSNIEETDAILNKQFEIIKDLLDDPCPLVRGISAIGVCMVLNYQWELVPLQIIKVFVKRLVDLSHDSSSSDVRASVIKGLTALMNNPLAHPTLKAVLSTFQDSFHDISEKVRLAFCNLLLKVKGIRSIKYWEIVPIEHLLARMEEDSSSVARRIVQLIYNSYLPASKPEPEWLERCISLIESDRGASRVFFQHVHQFVSIDVTVSFMLITCKTLYIYVKTRLESESLTAYSDLIASVSEENENKENISNNETLSNCSQNTQREFLFDNSEVVLGVLEATSILWIAIGSKLQLPANKKHYKLLVANFSKTMPVLLKFFKSSQAWDSLLYLSSFLPSTCLPSLGSLCLSHLKSFPETSKEAAYVTTLESICNHGQALDLLELIEQWMEYGLNKGSQNSQKKVSKRKKKFTTVEEHPPKPLLAVHFLETLLKQPICQDIVLKTQAPILRRILNQLQVAKIAVERLKTTQEFEQLIPFLPEAFSSYIKIAVLLHSNEQLEYCNLYEIFEDLFMWSISQFLTNKKESNGKTITRNAKKNISNFQQDTWNYLSFPICSILLTISSDMILIGVANEKFCSSSAKFATQVLKSEFGYMFIQLSARLMYQISGYATILFRLQSSKNQIEMLVPEILSNIIQLLASKKYEEKTMKNEIVAFKNILNELLLSLYCLPPKNEIVLQEIFSTIMASIVIENTHQLQKCQDIETYANKDLPFVTTTLLNVLCLKQEFMRMFLAEMNECLKSGALKDILEVSASITLLNIICQNKSFYKLINEDLKEIVATAEATLHAFAPSKDKTIDISITEAAIFASDLERSYYKLSRKQLRSAIGSIN